VLQAADLLYYDADKSKVTERLMANKKGHYAMFYFGDVNAEQAYLYRHARLNAIDLPGSIG